MVIDLHDAKSNSKVLVVLSQTFNVLKVTIKKLSGTYIRLHIYVRLIWVVWNRVNICEPKYNVDACLSVREA